MRENGQDEDTLLLQQVHEVAASDRRTAIAMLVTRMQGRSAPAALHQAYRELLRQEGLRDGLLEHGHIWIAALMANGESRRALGLVQECQEIDSAFLPDDPSIAGPLAALAARSGMSHLALRMCRGFLARWPRSPDTPTYGLLAARLLAATPERTADAVVLLGKLSAHWPDHPLRRDIDAFAQQLQAQTKSA